MRRKLGDGGVECVVWGSRSNLEKVCLAAEKVFKYSSQTRSGPINGKTL